MKFVAQIVISTTINADSKEEAEEEAESWQANMAESNDGSEIIANATVKVTEA